MMAAVVIYGVVAFFAVQGEPKSLGSLAVALPVAALFIAGTALWLRSRMDGSSPSLIRDLVVWCVDEGVAIVGLVAAMLSNNPNAFLPYGVASLVLLVLHRPQ